MAAFLLVFIKYFY